MFAEVMKNFTKKQEEFEELKKMSINQLASYHTEVKIEDIPADWRRQLEMHCPESEDGQKEHDEKTLVEFNQMKKGELSAIQEFMHILQDWVEEKGHELQDLKA